MRRLIKHITKKRDKKAAYKAKGVKIPGESPLENLPTEIWLLILEQMVGADPVLDPYSYLFGSVPGSLCRVNRRFNQFFTPILYYRFDFDGSLAQLKTLWLFLRTLVARPDLAELVRESTMTTYKFREVHGQPYDNRKLNKSLGKLYKENKATLVKAALQARLIEPEFDDDELLTLAKKVLYKDLHSKLDFARKDHRVIPSAVKHEHLYPAPLLALILAHCTRLTRLTYDTMQRDTFFQAILREATRRRRVLGASEAGLAFQHLETLMVSPQIICYLNGNTRRRVRSQGIGRFYPYHQLPQLKELFLHHAIMSLYDYTRQPVNALESLTMTDITSDITHLGRVMEVSPRLRKITLHLGFNRTFELTGPSIWSHEGLWRALSPLKDQLEYLDVMEYSYDSFVFGQGSYFPGDQNHHFCPNLAEFTKLRQLVITPLLLAGHQCPHRAPKKLRSHLPPNIESLGLYSEVTAWLNTLIKNFDIELEGIVTSAAKREKLKCIYLETENLSLPYMKMREAARRHHITFRTDGRQGMFSGGLDAPFANVYQYGSGYLTKDEALERTANRAKLSREFIPPGLEVFGVRGQLGSVKRPALSPPPELAGPATKRVKRA